MPLFADAQITVSPDVMFRSVGDEAVLLQIKRETYMGLDPVGTRMWISLTESESIEAAYQALLAEYEVEPAQLRRDLEEFVAKLIENELVLVTSPAAISGD